MGYFGQTADTKYELSQELLSLEAAKDQVAPLQLVRGANALLSRLNQEPRWQDSRSGISASFQTLIHDEKVHAYLSSTDISARAKALLAWGATQLTPEQAAAEGVGGLQRLNAEALEEHISQTQRLSQPGGSAWEVARETPAPFVDEAVRRGGQVKEVSSEFIDKAAPVGQGLVDNLDEKNITNPLLAVVSIALFVFMKNKLLAVIIIIGLIYLTKQRQIAEAKAKVQTLTGKITGTADAVSGAADAVTQTADSIRG